MSRVEALLSSEAEIRLTPLDDGLSVHELHDDFVLGVKVILSVSSRYCQVESRSSDSPFAQEDKAF